MKKILLTLAAFLMTVGMATAQSGKTSKLDVKKVGTAVVQKRGGIIDLNKKGMQKAPQKITLADNQKLMGPYTTDDVATSQQGLGLPNFPGELGVGALLGKSDIARFDGGNIVKMRYGLANAAKVSSVFVYLIDADGNLTELFTEPVTGTSVAGWNEVTLSKPYTLDLTGCEGLLMGFDYTQISTNTIEAYPLSVTGDVATTTLVYGNLGQGQGWYNIGAESYGSLSVQAVVEKDYPDYDLGLGNLKAYAYNKAGDKETFTFSISSFGKNVPQTYALDVAVDGQVVATYETPVALSDGTSALSGNIVLPAELAAGKHTLKLSVAKINGEVPVSNTADDVVTEQFTVYTQSFPHQKQLVEHFTSTSCTYCPLGDAVLTALEGKRDDIARVSVHGIQNPNYPDPYYIEACDVIIGYEELAGFPSASYNRTAFDFGLGEGLTLTQSLGYNANYKDQVATWLSEAIDENGNEYPSFASINVAANYNPTDGKLTVKVNGETVGDFAAVMGADAVLNVCLVEDGLVSRQLNGSNWITAYTHNNVLRKYVSNVAGDAINFNGNSYENDYVVDFASNWKPENMRVVAFISRPLLSESLLDKFVTNTETAALTVGDPAGIESAKGDANGVSEVARYTTNGVRLSAPQKGINIVKMSNGETRKVVVY